MRILVLSDSHGNVDNMARAVELTVPDRVLHLGDWPAGPDGLRARFPALPWRACRATVIGAAATSRNGCWRSAACGSLRCTGHTRNVKRSPMAAMYAAKEYGAQVLLFGHTHVPLVDNDGSLLTLNPGAAGDPLHPTCGVLTIENGRADVSHPAV